MRGSVLLLSLPALLTLSVAAPQRATVRDHARSTFVAVPEWAGELQSKPPLLEVDLTGIVLDAATGNPLAGAMIAVHTSSIGTISRDDGRFVLRLPDSLLGDSLHVTATLIGFETRDTSFVLRTGTNSLEIRLERAVIQLDEVVVTGGENRGRPATPPSSKPAPPPSRSEPPPASAGSTRTVAPERVAPPADRSAAPPAASEARVFPHQPRPHERPGESYARIEESELADPLARPLSTFSIDVDRASYSNVRRFIREGQAPPIDAVRIEELINYFTYDDPSPAGDVPFSVTMAAGPSPWNPGLALVRIGIQGRRIDERERPPSNLVFLVDVSGSMRTPDKLPLVKESLGLLVDEMRAEDRIAIVVYSGSAGLILPPTPGSHKRVIHNAIDRLRAGGSTAGGAGLELAYDVAGQFYDSRSNNRVILATDGDFNIGMSSDAEMIRLIEERRGSGTFLTVLGFGTGNLKDSKMEALADHGNGNYAYIDDIIEARKALVAELAGTLFTIASDVKVQVEFNPDHVGAYRLVGYENRLLESTDFADDTKDGGEIGAGHTVTALYEIVPRGSRFGHAAAEEPLRYQTERDRRPNEPGELMYVKLRYKQPGQKDSRLITEIVYTDDVGRPDADFEFAAAVAAWGMILRDSPHRGRADLDMVRRLALRGLGEDPGGHRAEFVRLVDESRPLLRHRVADGSH